MSEVIGINNPNQVNPANPEVINQGMRPQKGSSKAVWIILSFFIVIIIFAVVLFFVFSGSGDTSESDMDVDYQEALMIYMGAIYCLDECPEEEVDNERVISEVCFDSCFQEADRIKGAKIVSRMGVPEGDIDIFIRGIAMTTECISNCKQGSYYDVGCMDPCV